MKKSELDELANWLKVISEPNRLYLLEKIMQGVQCNCELGSDLDLAPNLISHHLGVMREAGIINVERDPEDARWGYYSVNPDVLREINQHLTSFLDPGRIQPRKPSCGPKSES